MPRLWQANGSVEDCAREPGLQRIAHLWLQRMRGVGHRRKHPERSAPGHVRRAQISLSKQAASVFICWAQAFVGVFLLTHRRPVFAFLTLINYRSGRQCGLCRPCAAHPGAYGALMYGGQGFNWATPVVAWLHVRNRHSNLFSSNSAALG